MYKGTRVTTEDLTSRSRAEGVAVTIVGQTIIIEDPPSGKSYYYDPTTTAVTSHADCEVEPSIVGAALEQIGGK